jgi:hypothetical protein
VTVRTFTAVEYILIAFQIAAASITVPGQIDVGCQGYCSALAVQSGVVRFVEMAPHAPRTLAIGSYDRADQHLVPRTEAPIRGLRTPLGWRVVVSAFLDHDQLETKFRLRFFDPLRKLQATYDALSAIEGARIGHLFGGADEIVAITSDEEHAYNVLTEIWFLPEQGPPKNLIRVRGTFSNFSVGSAAKAPGVTIARQTHDGVRAETKGTVLNFYAWDGKSKSLIQHPK